MDRPIDWTAIDLCLPLLAALPADARGAARQVVIEGGGLIFHRGDQPQAMHCVLTGEVRLIRRTETGSSLILQRSRGGFIAEASLDHDAYNCDAVASEASILLAIPVRAFNRALDDKSFRLGWIAHLARELRCVRAHAERLSLSTARERIAHFIETEGDGGIIILSHSKKDWASALGLTHEALYRALAQLKKDGRARVDGNRVQLLR
jgi:CRP/FNR family transcriptional regulator, dissimilatory nitrate respiration regulator